MMVNILLKIYETIGTILGLLLKLIRCPGIWRTLELLVPKESIFKWVVCGNSRGFRSRRGMSFQSFESRVIF